MIFLFSVLKTTGHEIWIHFNQNYYEIQADDVDTVFKGLQVSWEGKGKINIVS